MPRYKLIVEYDGTGLVGWQRQAEGDSVQALIETAIFKMTGEQTLVQGAGRTDAGVHATGQVAHVDISREYAPYRIQGALNFHLRPARVSILAVASADPTFHARLSATGRRYLYRILNRRAPPALELGYVWHVPGALDAAAMSEGAKFLLGHHDFTSFRATSCQAESALKTLDRLEVIRLGDEIRITAEARSFLHHQVRNMVGTLNLVGLGQWQPLDVRRALEVRDRAAAGPTAPPEGLCLTEVLYDGGLTLPKKEDGPGGSRNS